jgi:hypothetical protein
VIALPIRWTAGGLALVLATLTAMPSRPQPATADGACRMSAGDAAWVRGALDAWVRTADRSLKIRLGEPSDLVLFDSRCVWRARPRSASSGPGAGAEGLSPPGLPLEWKASPHGGSIDLPDGGQVPVGVVSFSAPWNNGRGAFLVMGLPSVWRAGGVTSTLSLEGLMTAVFVHESTHTRQFYAFSPLMTELTARWKLPDDIDDDSLQARFKNDPAYVKAWEQERDLLYRAAAEPDRARARALAREALALARDRRGRWFVGEDAKWNDVEDAFLTLEGIGNFAAFAWLTDPRGGRFGAAQALPQFRRGGRYWSQDEGLALYLVINRLAPGWQGRAFAAKPATAFQLWALAAGRP